MEKKRIIVVIAAIAIIGGLVLLFFRSCSSAWNPNGDDERRIEQPTTIQEPAGSVPQNEGKYKNDRRLSWETASGKTIYVGLENSPMSDYIYLNLQCSDASKDGNEIGFYVKSSRGLLEYSDWTVGLSDCDSGTNAEEGNFYIPLQMYNSVARIVYADAERYGVRWTDDGGDGTIGGATITARAVNLKTAEFIGIIEIMISYDETAGTYSITDIRSADVRETGRLKEDERAEAIQAAVEFAENEIFTKGNELSSGWQDVARAGAVVHSVDRTYFSRLINAEGNADKFIRHYTCRDTFAVTMPISYFGYVTVYLAPETEVMGLTEPMLYGSDELNLKVYGYDPLNPRDEDSLIAPMDFFSF